MGAALELAGCSLTTNVTSMHAALEKEPVRANETRAPSPLAPFSSRSAEPIPRHAIELAAVCSNCCHERRGVKLRYFDVALLAV